MLAKKWFSICNRFEVPRCLSWSKNECVQGQNGGNSGGGHIQNSLRYQTH